MFPKLVPTRNPAPTEQETEDLRKEIAARLELAGDNSFDEPLQVHAIFLVNDQDKWDQRIQLICDLLSTSDGKIAKKLPEIGPKDHIPVYCTNNDLLYRGMVSLPRMTLGCFNGALKEVYKLVYKRDLELKMYGKPCALTYEYTQKHLKNLANMEIGNIYMIGDNPKSDIRGGNAAGWTTILVQTGVFQADEEGMNDPEDPATYVVEDFVAAIKLICELEGIKCEIN